MFKQNKMTFLSCLVALATARSTQNYYSGDSTHYAGTGTHRGDTGGTNVMFAQDVVHHGNGGLFIGRGGGASGGGGAGHGGGNAFSIDDIHNQMNKAKMDSHAAAIAQKNAQLAAAKIKEEIAREVAAKKAEELAMLRALDKQAAVLEKEKPEILGKKAIPVVNFTEESNPLRHHMRMLSSRIEEIRETERRNIEAQRQLTRLDDITDKFRFGNAMIENPKLYSRFLAAGGVGGYAMDIPVTESHGSFYIKPRSGTGSHVGQEHVNDNKEYSEYSGGHTHFQNHGVHVPEKEVGSLLAAGGSYPLRFSSRQGAARYHNNLTHF